MPNFTSALYLALRHGSDQLKPWSRLTTGRPAALAENPLSSEVADRLSTLMGGQAAVLAPSTLHLFWDLFGLFDPGAIVLYVDESCYPIARWGIERATAQGAPVRRFPRSAAARLDETFRQDEAKGFVPIVIADGYSPARGSAAPLTDYLEALGESGGYLVIDDTQALGILGRYPDAAAPYGVGGGGTLQWYGISSTQIISIASLAKGFGVPIAVMTASKAFIRMFKDLSATRTHCSPPSAAALHAAAHALDANLFFGDVLRRRLWENVATFRSGIANLNVMCRGGLFPVQTLYVPTVQEAFVLHNRLRSKDVHAVLQGKSGRRGALSFLLTARHSRLEIEMAVQAIAEALEMPQPHWR